ncbi:MAG: hypothetical protein FWG42_04185 [Clostridiales bacterium]|nr:hypothetical protein [Clostridiales bacterium]
MAPRGLDKELSLFEIAVCENQGDLFEESQYDFNCDAFDFVTKFMNSEIAGSLDQDLSMCHTWGIKQIGETLISMVEIEKHSGEEYISRDCLHWVGYLYRYWAWWLGTSSRQIILDAPVALACAMYDGYHTLDMKAAILMFLRTAPHFY